MDLVEQLALINDLPYEVDTSLPEEEEKLDLYVIMDPLDHTSIAGIRRLVKSVHETQTFKEVFFYPQLAKHTLHSGLRHIKNLTDPEHIEWNWPKTPEEDNQFDIKTGLYKFYLPEHNQALLIYQTMTHIKLWDLCIERNEPIIISNSNQYFNFKIDLRNIKSLGFINGVLGLNARNAETYNSHLINQVMENDKRRGPIKNPSVVFQRDAINNPIPFLGHGCYIITPWGAKKGMEIIEEYGLMPIQFLLCNQLAPWTKIMWKQVSEAKGMMSTVWKPKK